MVAIFERKRKNSEKASDKSVVGFANRCSHKQKPERFSHMPYLVNITGLYFLSHTL